MLDSARVARKGLHKGCLITYQSVNFKEKKRERVYCICTRLIELPICKRASKKKLCMERAEARKGSYALTHR